MRKKEFMLFTIFEYEKEQEYLRDMHKKGWKFIKVTGLGMYHFEKCEPEDVIYQLDYNQDASENKDEYIQMFADCGWQYIQDFMGYSYFSKPVSQMATAQEEIFCDDSSKLEMLKRVYKGKMIPLLFVFSAVLIPQMFIQTMLGNYVLTGIYVVILVWYIHTLAKATKIYKEKERG